MNKTQLNCLLESGDLQEGFFGDLADSAAKKLHGKRKEFKAAHAEKNKLRIVKGLPANLPRSSAQAKVDFKARTFKLGKKIADASRKAKAAAAADVAKKAGQVKTAVVDTATHLGNEAAGPLKRMAKIAGGLTVGAGTLHLAYKGFNRVRKHKLSKPVEELAKSLSGLHTTGFERGARGLVATGAGAGIAGLAGLALMRRKQKVDTCKGETT